MFNISPWWDSLWLFEKSYTLFLVAFPFPSRILVCVTGFCSSISLYILRFTFGELILAKKKKKSGKIYRHKSMHVSRSTKPLTNHSWQVWRSIYNNHIDIKISSTMIWMHREQAMLVNAQSHKYKGTRQNMLMTIHVFMCFGIFDTKTRKDW